MREESSHKTYPQMKQKHSSHLSRLCEFRYVSQCLRREIGGESFAQDTHYCEFVCLYSRFIILRGKMFASRIRWLAGWEFFFVISVRRTVNALFSFIDVERDRLRDSKRDFNNITFSWNWCSRGRQRFLRNIYRLCYKEFYFLRF